MGACEKSFAIPDNMEEAQGPSSRTTVCIHKDGIRFIHKCGEEGQEACPGNDECSIKFEAANGNDLALSTPTELSNGSPPLYTLLEEESECFGFFCPDIEQALR